MRTKNRLMRLFRRFRGLHRGGDQTWSRDSLSRLYFDTGATVMRTLGLQTHTEWDSRAWKKYFILTFAAAAPRGSSSE